MPMSTPSWRAEAPEAELRARATEMRTEWADLSKTDRESDDYRSAKREFLNEIEDIDTQLSLRQMETPSVRRAPAGALGGTSEDRSETRSPGQIVAEHEGFRTWCRQNAGRDHLEGPSPTIEVRDLVSLATSANLTLPVMQPELIGVRRKRFFVRNLMSVVSVTQAAVPYIRELNEVANRDAATTVPEATQAGTPVPKPQAKIEFTTDLAHVATIAVNIPITTQMLEDNTFIQGYVDARLPYLLAIREEAQLLNGDGAGSNIRGILQTPGVQTQAATAGDPAISIMNGMVKIKVLDAFPDAVVMNPVDAAAMWTRRQTTSGGLDAGTPFASVPQNVWGLPVVETNGIVAGHAIVANWQLGATVLDRRSANVRTYEQHSDYVIYNKVLVQAEERVGIMVTNPDYFCVVAL